MGVDYSHSFLMEEFSQPSCTTEVEARAPAHHNDFHSLVPQILPEGAQFIEQRKHGPKLAGVA